MQFREEIILKGLNLANFELKTYQLIDSTNDECKRISSNKDILVVTADQQTKGKGRKGKKWHSPCLLYTSPSPRDRTRSRMPSSA